MMEGISDLVNSVVIQRKGRNLVICLIKIRYTVTRDNIVQTYVLPSKAEIPCPVWLPLKIKMALSTSDLMLML